MNDSGDETDVSTMGIPWDFPEDEDWKVPPLSWLKQKKNWD